MFQRYRNSRAGAVRFVCVCGSLIALWIASGCGSLPDDTGSIFQVAGIQPTYFGSNTNQVDVVPFVCSRGEDSADVTPEDYSDHTVSVSFLNRHWPNRLDEHTAGVLTLKYYDLHYTPLDTLTANYPLPSRLAIPVPQTIAIPACSPGPPGQICPPTTMTGGYFIPFETKKELREHLCTEEPCFDPQADDYPGYLWPQGVEPPQLAYAARYVFYAENEFGKETAPATASFDFYVSDYNYCD